MRVKVDQEVCCASGLCALTVPDVFDQREADGIVTLLNEQPPEPLHSEVIEAEEQCPSGAITVEQ